MPEANFMPKFKIMSAAEASESFRKAERAKQPTIAYAVYSADGERRLYWDDPHLSRVPLLSTDFIKELIYKE